MVMKKRRRKRMSFKLGILDQSPIFPGESTVEAFKQTIHLAKYAEKWGYTRFWVSEHHHSDQLAGSSPEVLISYLLAQTKSIRIGSGGVLLQHYSPYKVAENFHVLSHLAPGRVDLGIGKAPGGLPLSTRALQFGTENDGADFEDRLSFLQQLIEDSVNINHPLAGIEATPIPNKKPETFLLGASARSAELAAHQKMTFVFGLFFNSHLEELEKASQIYHEHFLEGTFIVGVSAIAASTQQEAEQLENNQKILKVHLEDGRSVKVLTREQGELFGQQAGIPYTIEEQDSGAIAGTADYVKAKLEELHRKYSIDEFILHNPILNKEKRFQSFQLLRPIQVYNSEKVVY